jgi:hypothetical protein
MLAYYYERLRSDVREDGLPENRRLKGRGAELLLRRLDCFVINYCLSAADRRDQRMGATMASTACAEPSRRGLRPFQGGDPGKVSCPGLREESSVHRWRVPTDRVQSLKEIRMPPRIIDPYREFNEATMRWVDSLTREERIAFLKEIGLLNRQGRVAAFYRGPRKRKRAKTKLAKPKLAKPKSTKTAKTRKRAAS